MSNFFAGIEKTEREGASRGKYFTDGEYLVEIQSFTARKSSVAPHRLYSRVMPPH